MRYLNNKLPSVPVYYAQLVDPKVNLDDEPSQPCPFHGEKTGKSFTWSKTLGRWRCWGKCHCGGDVIDLHKLNYKLKSREEALQSLCEIYRITITRELSFESEEVEVDEVDVYRRRVYSLALTLAKTPEDWLDLDYIVSKVPYDVKELELFCNMRGHRVTSIITEEGYT